MKTLDWSKLEAFIKEREPVEVDAGIIDDWFWTAATVYKDGEWQDRDRAYVTSSWATPGFKATMRNGDVVEVISHREETPEEEEGRIAKRNQNMSDLKELASKLKQ